ncbi:hypothetical protein LSAT2_001613 [Lamellibrachia satsuma]|nr:hypothetical protein LSAT2_001613 [Lamellibrachia satsuma]
MTGLSPTDGCCRLQVMLLLLSVSLIHMVFGISVAVLLLGFSVVQFLAVSQPLRYDHLVTVTKVRVALVGVWLTCTAVALLPIIAYFVQFGAGAGCSTERMRYIETLTMTGTNICVDLLMLIYVTIVALCLRIYVIIRQLQRRLSTSVHSWQNDVHYERRTFQSIVVLVVTMTVFTVPYCIVYIVTMNAHSDNMAGNTAMLYYMNLLPYFKFASDPLIYRRGVTQLKSDLKKVLRSCRCRMGRHRLRLRRLPAFRQRRLYSKRVNLYLGNSNKNCRVTTV